MSNQISNDILTFVNFINQRLKQFIVFTLLEEHKDRWNAAVKMLEPCLPTLKRSGYIPKDSTFFPPLIGNQCSIVISPHFSDVDWAVIFAYGNPFLNKDTIDNQDRDSHNKNKDNSSETKEEPKYTPLQPTALTHSHFGKVPVIGPSVIKLLIGVHPGMTETELINAINAKRKEGYNVFVLFPEAGVHCKSKIESNHKFWSTNVAPNDPFEYKELLYPRFTGYQCLVKALGTDLQYIVDITLRYPFHKPWEVEFNYTNYPSIISFFSKKPNSVQCHTNIINVNSRWESVISKEWFIEKLWKPKEKLLRKWRKLEEQAHSGVNNTGDNQR